MQYSSVALLLAAAVAPVMASPVPDTPRSQQKTVLDGDGAPMQRYYYTQVTENISCNDDTCSAGQSKSVALSVGFTIGSGSDVSNWINGGFSVSESFSTSETDSCGGDKDQTVCLWYAVAHTAYNVYDCDAWGDCAHKTINSPNNDNQGGGYLCGSGAQCKDKNHNFWKDGPKGGPQSNPDSTKAHNLD